MVLSLVLCVSVVSLVQCRPEYLQRIPNAYSVKTEDGMSWLAVGHTDSSGEKPARNVFGRDFQQHGLRWSVSLCETDSDGDGMTNGEELGDPQCVWSPGNDPTRTTNITHPGICEPKADPKCQVNNTVDCGESGSEECEPGSMTTAKPEEENNADNDENTVNLQGTADSSNEKSNNWTKGTTILVAFGVIALLILVAVVIKVILHFVK